MPLRVLAALIAPVAILFSGCSDEVERIVGNERLIRGPGGLGSTSFFSSNPDRDTYVTPETMNAGSTLLIGHSSSFEARSFMIFKSFTLPDTNLLDFAPSAVMLELSQAQLRLTPGILDIDFGIVAATLPDSGSIAWPGPALGTPLASTSFNFTGPIVFDLGPGSFGLYKQWALDPNSMPGFILRAPLVQGIAGFQSRKARFIIPYTWNKQGTTTADTVYTTVTRDFYLHPPLTPAPTGTDTALALGGGFESKLAVRTSVPPIGAGYSVSDLRLVLSVTDPLPGVDGSTLKNVNDNSRVDITLSVRRIGSAWPEGATDDSTLAALLLPVAVMRSVAAGAGDSISIPLPTSLARLWAESPASNEGVLISVESANVNPGVMIGSRESTRPPILRVGTTSPPPGRF